MPTCNVEGCEDQAVGSLIGLDGYVRAYRCLDCLLFDLRDNEAFPDPGGRL